MANKKEENTPANKKGSEMAPAPSAGGLIAFDDLDNFFEDFLSRRWPRLLDWSVAPMHLVKSFPKVDIIEHDKEIEVQAALPGVKKDDLEVTINDQSITIRTTTKEEKEEKKAEGKYFRREISRGEYQRTLSLPDYVDRDNAKASFKDGILTVTLPKTEKGKRKSIEIK